MNVIQEIVNRAVDIAVQYALTGVEVRVQWIEPENATSDPRGELIVIVLPPKGATD